MKELLFVYKAHITAYLASHYKVYSLSAILGVIGGTIIKELGGWGEDLKTLIGLMGIDMLMGILIAIFWKASSKTKNGALESKACFRGLVKKGAALAFVYVGNRLDITLGMDYIRTAVIIAFIANELISIVENAGLMGLKYPQIITDCIEMLKKKQEKEDE